ncbi:nitrogen fixation protein NifZ [Novosphingobium mangrovi (ex Huang et al. 2023)]|uniref:Nitrogen fixation protein NifZ n=1 Tax=Novosphingobium mangrovi (ex Huang et al. 2023) TaxID=2976432 RepID=A0ABT2I689_9SPHN|nr:nitrogen fixation protein NifZ [Novosphingobium mangrovi (ex Huang et al. 2023)]MCT2400329.1 nitrogen fixation protein NifZ [Novosphingobium mangrovi (ex Huang et al. 2023)]
MTMMDIREPVFGWGERVAAAVDLVNDGSYPGVAAEAVLAEAGSVGEIVNVGHHADANIPVYLVEFLAASGTQVVVGCLEEELVRV